MVSFSILYSIEDVFSTNIRRAREGQKEEVINKRIENR
jgi:hypothetical protein